MEENENISNLITRIKELKDKLCNIVDKLSIIDLVTIVLNGMLDEYNIFITSLVAREKTPSFDDFIGIL